MRPQSLRPATTYGTLVGEVLGTMRKGAGMTQSQLADAMGLTQSAWSRLESGVNALTIDQIREAAGHLGVRPQDIFAAAEKAAERLSNQGVEVETAKPSGLDKGSVLVATAIVGAAVGAALALLLGRKK